MSSTEQGQLGLEALRARAERLAQKAVDFRTIQLDLEYTQGRPLTPEEGAVLVEAFRSAKSARAARDERHDAAVAAQLPPGPRRR